MEIGVKGGPGVKKLQAESGIVNPVFFDLFNTSLF